MRAGFYSLGLLIYLSLVINAHYMHIPKKVRVWFTCTVIAQQILLAAAPAIASELASEPIVSDVQEQVVAPEQTSAEPTPVVEPVVEEVAPVVAEEPAVETEAAETVADAVVEPSVETVTEPVVEEQAEVVTEPAADVVTVGDALVETISNETASTEVAPASQLTTDKADYMPGQVATIFGNLFQTFQSFILKIFGSDENSQNYTETVANVTSDENGSFSYQYQLDDLYRPFYEVVATDTTGNAVAQTWFRDASIGTYDQCSNDDGDGYNANPGNCNWINGNLNGNNSTYQEGESTVQRLWLEGFAPNSSHTVTLQYGTTKQGKHAYDFLTTWSHSENWITPADRCDGITGCTSAPDSSFPIPNDTNGSGQFQGTVGSRDFVVRGGTITGATAPALSGSYAGDSETTITVTFTVAGSGSMCSTKGQVTSCGIAIWFGAHIADTAQWFPFNGTSGATSISGSPYHVALSAMDGGSIGNRDNQMQASVIPSTIIIHKNTDPDSAQDFSFTTTGTGLSNFSLDDDADGTLSNTITFTGLNSGSFTVTEASAPGYAVTISCTDPTNNTSVNNTTRVASIALGDAETVECTFTNTLQQGSLVINKVAVGGNGTFGYTVTGPTPSTPSIVTANGAGTTGTMSVNAGSYSVSESTIPAGWDLTSASCSNGTPANFTVTAGQTTTCTFTNTKRGSIIVDKVTVPGGSSQLFTFNPSYGQSFQLADSTTPNNSGSLVPGTYSVSEDAVAGWVQTSATCSDNSPVGAISLQAGEIVTCTFTNTKQPTLTVNKVVVPAQDSGLFNLQIDGSTAGTGSNVGNGGTTGAVIVSIGAHTVGETAGTSTSLSDYVTSIGGDCAANGTVSLAAGDNKVCVITNTLKGHIIVDKVTNPSGDQQSFDFTTNAGSNFSLTDAATPHDSGAVAPGTYSVAESVPAGWDLTSATCSDGSNPNSIGLSAGETVTCTFTNTKRGHIIVDKVTDPAGDSQSFSFTTTGVGYSGFSLTDAAAPNNQEVVPGSYSVSETGIAGWDLTSATCDQGETPASLDVEPGETVTCTFNNQKDSIIIVEKQTLPDGNSQSFSFTSSYSQGFSLTDGQQNNSGDLNPGIYSVSETVPQGWNQSGVTCSDGSQPDAINLAAGETVTCVFTNTKRGTLNIVKNTIGDNGTFNFTGTGGNGLPANFGISTTANTGSQSYSIIPGTYGVGESVPANWVLQGATCDDGSAVDDIQVAPGETVTCTFTNRAQGKIKIIKNAVGGDGTFNYLVTGPTGSSQQVTTVSGAGNTGFITVTAGSYSVSEVDVPAGWDMTNATCTSGTPAGFTIGAGSEVICTFTNTKRGKIIVEKQTDPNGSEQLFDFTASYDQDGFSLSDNGQNDSGLLVPGTYSVSETVPAGWDLINAECSNEGGPSEINLGPGEVVTCVFTNQADANIIVVKQTDPDGSQALFEFDPSYAANFFLTDGQQNNSGDLNPGTYSVSEIVPAGWDLLSATCTDGTPASISLQAGETVTCTFTNQADANIIVVKQTYPEGSQQSFNFSASYDNDGFALADNGQNDSGDLNPGTYSVSETVPAGWAQVSAECSDESDPSNIGLIAGETVTCTFTNVKPDAKITLTPLTATNEVDDNHVVTATVMVDSGNGFVAAPDNTLVTFSFAQNTAGASFVGGNTCLTSAGSCSITINSTSAGLVQLHAATDVSPLGVALHRETDGLNGNSVDAAKTYVDASLSLSPLEATNAVNDPHTITATVTKNDGTGVTPAVGVTVDFSVAPGSATFVGGDSDCVTNGSGECSIQIVSSTTGSNTIDATTTFTVDGISLTRATDGDYGPDGSGSASKQYVNARISIDPSQATNEVGDPHTFTITVESDNGDGSGFQPVAEATVNVLVMPAPDSLDKSDCLDGTNASGQCVAIINSSVAGVFTTAARSTITVGGVEFKLQTDGTGSNSEAATKTYVDAKIVLSPLTATNNIGDAHTINATVSQNNGSGWSAAPDNTLVTFSLVNNTAGAAFVGAVNSCTTTAGACSVQINTLTPGSVDIHATTTFSVGGVSLTRASDGTHGSSGDANKLYVAGSLNVAKALNLGSYPFNVNTSFDVTVTGPSYPGGTTLTFNVVNGVVTNTPQTLTPLIPGAYTVTEVDPGIAWTVTGNGGVNVVANETAEKTITNTLKQPHTTISITPNTYETSSTENVILTITDTNDGQVPLTNPSVTLTYGVNSVTLDKANYYVSGDVNANDIMDVGETWTWSYSLLIGADTTFNVAGHGLDPLGNDISPENGYTTEAGSVVVRVINTTRTIGFWQTHTNFTTSVYTTYGITVGNNGTHKGPIDTAGKLFGGFYAPIAKKSDGSKRTPEDQARITLLQQLLAAKLNCAAFGCSPATQANITAADAAYVAGNKATIMSYVSILDSYNNSGDNGAIPPSLGVTGKATPKNSQSIAATVFWNQP